MNKIPGKRATVARIFRPFLPKNMDRRSGIFVRYLCIYFLASSIDAFSRTNSLRNCLSGGTGTRSSKS